MSDTWLFVTVDDLPVARPLHIRQLERMPGMNVLRVTHLGNKWSFVMPEYGECLLGRINLAVLTNQDIYMFRHVIDDLNILFVMDQDSAILYCI